MIIQCLLCVIEVGSRSDPMGIYKFPQVNTKKAAPWIFWNIVNIHLSSSDCLNSRLNFVWTKLKPNQYFFTKLWSWYWLVWRENIDLIMYLPFEKIHYALVLSQIISRYLYDSRCYPLDLKAHIIGANIEQKSATSIANCTSVQS